MTTDRGVYRYLHIHWLVYTLLSLFCQLRGPKSNRRTYLYLGFSHFSSGKRTRDPWRNGACSQIRAGNTQDAAGTLIMPENKKMFKKSTVYKIHLIHSFISFISFIHSFISFIHQYGMVSPYHTYIDKGFN